MSEFLFFTGKVINGSMKERLRALVKHRDKLKTFEGDEYYKAEEWFKFAIKDFLNEFGYNKPLNICDLSKNDFIELCSMMSSHRPIEPWQFLRDISMCNDARKERQNVKRED